MIFAQVHVQFDIETSKIIHDLFANSYGGVL